ncbi:MAG: phosphodiester glycosidase family protein, partial [Cyanobacteria bacterium P01_D01_bin.73]
QASPLVEASEMTGAEQAAISGSMEVAQAQSTQVFQGDRLTLNGRNVTAPWVRWTRNGRTHIGIGDGVLVREFGVDLEDGDRTDIQAVRWFSESSLPLPVLHYQNTRYLGIGAIAQGGGWTVNPSGSTLEISWEPAQVVDFQALVQGDRWRYVLELDRPAPFQVSPVPGELTLGIDADLNLPEPPPSDTPELEPASEQDPAQDDAAADAEFNAGAEAIEAEPPAPVLPINADLSAPLVTALGRTVIRFPTDSRSWLPQAFTLLGPNRIVIEASPDILLRRSLQWAPGVRWRQELMRLGNDLFPVTWVELDPDAPEVDIVPVPALNDTRTGIASVWDTARRNQVAIAVNGGYFNRINKLPLGAMRRDGQWLSGPILNRGAIAWNDAGEFTFGRLKLEESVTANGKAWPVISLNSGYVKAGIARYDKNWGPSYVTMTDNEVGIIVQGDRVVQQIPVASPGGNIPIPDDGYLLVTRSFQTAANALPVGTDLVLSQQTVPANFSRFPNIVAAGPLLVADGQMVLDAAGEGFSAAFIRERAARSAIAQRSDGKILIVAVHNRRGGRGPSLAEMAQLVQSMGAVNALNLDGGSSTTIYVGGQTLDRPSRTSARVHGIIGIFLNVPF